MAMLPENAAIYLPSLYPINFYPFLIKSTHAAILSSNIRGFMYPHTFFAGKGLNQWHGKIQLGHKLRVAAVGTDFHSYILKVRRPIMIKSQRDIQFKQIIGGFLRLENYTNKVIFSHLFH